MAGCKNDYNDNVYYGLLIKGQLNNAIAYLSKFDTQKELYQKYIDVFVYEQYLSYDIAPLLNDILLFYQKYYRDVFYLAIGAEHAEEKLKRNLANFLGINDENLELSDLENQYIAKAFNDRKLQFLGGKTSGYFGPYIWKNTETKVYNVELPDGIQEYTVKLLDGFISKSWCDYVSFGVLGTGGWTDGEGFINCIKSSYNLEDETFTVSLLKHEAQHANDLTKYPQMSAEDLEYRAKLVELIYSTKRNLLSQFIYEADGTSDSNGHALAANKIVSNITKNTNNDVSNLTVDEISEIAQILFEQSNIEIKLKYSK